jgi:hypothetical protein
MAYYSMVIQDASEGGRPSNTVHVFLYDPFWGPNTFKIGPNYWTGAMNGTYQYYPTTKSIVFFKYAAPGEPEDEIRMRWDFINYPDDCQAAAGKSGEGDLFTNFNPGLPVTIQWASAD